MIETVPVKQTFEPLIVVSVNLKGEIEAEFKETVFTRTNYKGSLIPSVLNRALRTVSVRYRQYRRDAARVRRIETVKQAKERAEENEKQIAKMEI